MPNDQMDDSPVFLCGEHGCDVFERDEHTQAGREYADAMNRAAFDAGKSQSIEQYAEWLEEGEELSRWAARLGHRLTIREYHELNAAEALLKRHGYAIRPPRSETPDLSFGETPTDV